NEWCRAFAAQLRQMNLSVWYDEVNLSHGKLVPEIVRVLRTGPAFIVVLSPAAVASPWVWLETGAALAAQDQDNEPVVLPVLAQAGDIPPIWSSCKRVSGSNDTAISPVEAARQVGQALGRRQPWTEESTFASFARCCSAEGLAAARHLYSFARQHGASVAWGKGALPSLSARFMIGGKPYSVFSLYEWPAGRASCSINFEYLTGGAISDVALARLADHLRAVPMVAYYFEGLEQAKFLRRPALPIDQILTQPRAVETFKAVVLEFVESSNVQRSLTSISPSA
ncbi:MAG TPA: toll/interleukin-1 receptor domain-containing protein, partial [Ktedonobacterales bacterium]